MFETILIVALVLAIIIAAVLIVAATKPDTFRVERAATVHAPAEKVFPLISDFRQWLNWSPWEGRDPALSAPIRERSAARARSMPGRATGMSAPAAWKSSKPIRPRRS